MKVAYFDCFAGISGDMIIGALIDLGLDINLLSEELSKLNMRGFKIDSSKSIKNGITGTKFNVEIADHKTERKLNDIVDIISQSTLDRKTKEASINVFTKIAMVEASIHGKEPDEIHFHEIGALDSIVDIVGTIIGINALKIDKVFSSKIHVGTGFIKRSHGKIPVPAPATIELLKNAYVYSTGIEQELTTPTGAALITHLAEDFIDIPEMKVIGTGYGAGTRDLEIPNLLRIVLGEMTGPAFQSDILTLIETNIDDFNPELYNYVFERLFEHGAMDVYLVPIIMKKSRPGNILTVLAEGSSLNELLDIIFSETTTSGVRINRVQRRKLERSIVTVKTKYGEVAVKIHEMNNRIITVSPEFEECVRLAREKNVPVKIIYDEAKMAFYRSGDK